jgi:hypothetical protein
MLSMACVFVWEFGLSSVEIWVDGVSIDVVVWAKVRMVETVGIHQVIWLVMLESAKDRILGVDPLGQHVPPHVQYEMACWLIREAQVSYLVRCAVLVWWYLQGRKVQEGHEGIVWYPTRGNLRQSKTFEQGLTFIKVCSDLWAIHQKKYKEW